MATIGTGSLARTVGEREGLTYDAFISYSHAADGSLAPAIQQGLQMLAKPLYQRKASRIFRDQTNLAATPGLWPTIEQALQASRFFVLLASPVAAASAWVQQEVQWWQRHRDHEHLLIVLTHGTITWDSASADFDWDASDALPTCLSGWIPTEPLWVDMRWTNERSALSHRDPRLQEDLAALAAPLRGIPKDDLIGRDLVLHRRAVRLTQIAVTLLVLLSLGAGLGAWVAWAQKQTADRQTVLAESRALAAGATSTIPTRLDRAWLLAQRGTKMNPTPDNAASLFETVKASPHLTRFLPQSSPVSANAWLPAGELAVGHADGSVSVTDTTYSRQQTLGAAGGHVISSVAVGAGGDLLAAGDAAGSVQAWSLTRGSLLWRRPLIGEVQAVAVSPEGGTIAAVMDSNTVSLLDARTGIVRQEFRLGDADLGQYQQHAKFLTETQLLVGDEVGAVQMWQTRPKPRLINQHVQAALADVASADAWSPDGRTYAFAARTEAAVVDAQTGRRQGDSFTALRGQIDAIAVDNRGEKLAFLSDGVLAIRDRSGAARIAGRSSVELSGYADAELLAFSTDARWLVAGGSDALAVFDLLQPSRLAAELPEQLGPLACEACRISLAVDPQGRSVVWTDGTTVVCRNLRRSSTIRYPNATDAYGMVGFPSDGSMMFSFGGGKVGVWQLANGCPQLSSVRWLQIGDQGDWQLLPVDPHRVVLASSLEARLVDLRDGRVVRTFRAPKGEELSAGAISSDTGDIALSLSNGDIAWYDLDSGILTGTAHSGSGRYSEIAFLPGSHMVAQTTPTTVDLWDPKRGRLGRFEGSAQRLVFSPDGRMLIGLGAGEVARLWDVTSRRRLGSLQMLPLVNDEGEAVAGGSEQANQVLFDQADKYFFGEGAALPPDYKPPQAKG